MEEKKKILHTIYGNTMRELMNAANNTCVTKDEIVAIKQDDNHCYYLIYYR